MKTNEKKITAINREQILNLGRQTLAIEAQAVSALQNRLGESFVCAVE